MKLANKEVRELMHLLICRSVGEIFVGEIHPAFLGINGGASNHGFHPSTGQVYYKNLDIDSEDFGTWRPLDVWLPVSEMKRRLNVSNWRLTKCERVEITDEEIKRRNAGHLPWTIS